VPQAEVRLVGSDEGGDAHTELALILAAIAPGHLKATKTTALLTMEEAVEAMKKACALTYVGPKG
jgi:hypothetical protein